MRVLFLRHSTFFGRIRRNYRQFRGVEATNAMIFEVYPAQEKKKPSPSSRDLDERILASASSAFSIITTRAGNLPYL